MDAIHDHEQDDGPEHEPEREYGELTREQLLLLEIRDKLCGGNASRLAREIGRDATYVNRLFYPPGKPGRKGIGLSIMQACLHAFGLPLSFWGMKPPAIPKEFVDNYLSLRDARNRAAHGMGPGPFPGKWSDPNYSPKGPIIPAQPASAAPRDDFARGARDINASYLAALQPIHTWEYEADLPEGEFAMVPRLDVKLSAGAGSGANQLTFDFDDGQLRAYSADWVRRNHLKPNKLRVMKGHGRSMEPTIFDGDDLLINLAETDIVDGKVYALWYEGGERVKRLYRMPGGGLRIRSDNDREFPEIVLGPEYTGHVRVIGRVIDRSGPGGL